MKKEGRSVQFHFYVSEQEAAAIQERMEQIGVANLSAYLRKMAVDGYIIHLDMSGVQELVRLLRICSNNLNQYARRANETGSIYAADVRTCASVWTAFGTGWISCSGDLLTFHERAFQPLLSRNRHG